MQKVTHLFAGIIMASLAIFVVSCGDDENNPNSCDLEGPKWQNCKCDDDTPGFESCELIEDSEDAEWGECTCAARYARFCVEMEYGSSTSNDTSDAICTLTLRSDTEAYTFESVRSWTCDSPKGAHCLPMPASNEFLADLSCAPDGFPDEKTGFNNLPVTLIDEEADHIFFAYYDANITATGNVGLVSVAVPLAHETTGDMVQRCESWEIDPPAGSI